MGETRGFVKFWSGLLKRHLNKITQPELQGNSSQTLYLNIV